MPLRRSFLFLICLLASLRASAQTFTIIALPDTQNEAQFFPAVLQSQTNWIVQNRAALNIQVVIGEGDIVNDGSDPAQWRNADAAYRLLDSAGIPYFAAIGNHDYDHALPKTRLATGFNQWFGPSRYSAYPWYEGNFPSGSNENFYGVVNIGGAPYLFLALEFMPQPATMQWAESILSANPEKPAIVVTHAFVNSKNLRPGRCENGDMPAPNENPELMWAELRDHQNLTMVLSGHFTTGKVGVHSDIANAGNLVNQVYTDYQDDANGGDGWLRILTFNPPANTISVKTYSPYLHQYKTDAKNQYTLFMTNPHLQTGAGTLSGRVLDTATCKAIAGATVSIDDFSAVSGSDGHYALSLPPDSYSISANATHYSAATQSERVSDGFDTHLNFYLSPYPCELNPASPSVTICTPTNGATVESPVAVSAGTTDKNQVTLLKAYVDGHAVATSHSGILVSSVSIASGAHRLTVQAKDSKGVTFKQTININVTQDAQPH